MDSVEAVCSRTPLGTLTQSQQNSEAGDADFSKLTPSHFGISTDSFITFKEKDKSRVSQLKSRRRSTIGVRGSPETNSLICFRAKEVLKTPPQTPQHMLESPLFSGCDSIKQKMAAFQRLMGEDEDDVEQSTALMTGEKDGKVGGGLPSDSQADTDACSKERENRLTPGSHRPAVTPPPSKRRRRVTRGLCSEEIQEEPGGSDLQEPETHSSQLKSPALSLGLGSDSQSQLMSLPMLSKPEVMRTDDPEVSSVSKKKRVRFGAPLSPEFFDKTLPPSTPLQKGATPLRPPSSTAGKHSLLKTPQRFDPPLPQPDSYSPKNNGASPVFRIPRSRSKEEDSDEVFLYGEKISFPVLEEEPDLPADHSKDALLAEGPDPGLHHQSPTASTEFLDTAFQDEEAPIFSTVNPPSTLTDSEPEPSLEQQQNLQEQQCTESPASTAEAPRPRGRKRKQQAEQESEPEKTRGSRKAPGSRKKAKTKPVEKQNEDEPEARRSSRTAAASAKGKLKAVTANRRFGSKKVDRSLYGKRDYASKNPLLSPIIESATASLTNTPTPQPHPDSNSSSESDNQTTNTTSPSGTADSSEGTAGLVAAAALWRQRFLQPTAKANSKLTDSEIKDSTTVVDSSTSQSDAEEASDETLHQTGVTLSGRKVPKVRRNSGRPAGRRRNASSGKAKHPTDSAQESETEECLDHEEPTSGSSGSDSSTLLHCEAATQQQSDEPMSTAEHSEGSEPETMRLTVLPSEKNEEQPCHVPLETNSSPEQNEEPTESSEPVLESWQEANFNIEDILKPVKVQSRGSVRRSLRNRRSMDVQASGLAWVDHTSPELMAAGHKRRRSRLSAVSQPPSGLEYEEVAQHNLRE